MTNAATSSAAGREGGSRCRLALRGLLVAGILGLIACPGSKLAPTHDNVLLVTVDTLRADYVHSYGFFADITPNIDALAARGALFETAVATSTATVPAHASIMTSRFVREHSVGSHNGPTRLEGLTTLAERFREAGYDTAAFVGNVVLKRRSGLDRGFDVYDDDLFGSEPNRIMYFERDAEATSSRVLEWLSPRDPGAPRAGASVRGDGRERPFFLWVHLQDPHGPYAPPRSYAERVERIELRTDRELATMRANLGRGGIPHYQKLEGLTRPSEYARRYAGEVAYADHWIGRIVEAVERASEGSGVVILLIADHGESLDEDGFFFQHGHSTTPEQALVPFVLVAPGIEPRRVREAVSQVDVAPTLLEFAGLPALPGSSGVSLLPLLLRGEAVGDRLLYSDVGADLSVYQGESYLRINGPGLTADSDGDRTSSGVVESQLMWDGFRSSDGGGWHRAESRPPLRPEILAYLRAEVPLVPAHAMSDEDIERLRALGYLPPDPGEPSR